MSNDPARIAAAITDVATEIGRWSQYAATASGEADHLQQQAVESSRRATQSASITSDRVGQHRSAMTALRREVDRGQAAASTAVSKVTGRIDRVRAAAEFAEQVLHAWQSELNMALAWQRRAQERVALAEQMVQHWKRELQRAKWALSAAVRAFNSCQRDEDRKNCNSEARDVERAEAAVNHAARMLAEAEEELRLARIELEAALRRVACCNQAVNFATSAVQSAQSATTVIAEANQMASWGSDYALSTREGLSRADGHLQREEDASIEMTEASRRAAEYAAEAGMSRRQAASDYESGQRYAFDARRDLAERIDRLRAFDQGRV